MAKATNIKEAISNFEKESNKVAAETEKVRSILHSFGTEAHEHPYQGSV